MNAQTEQNHELKAVIFDLDGVVFDSRHANIIFYNHMLEAVGLSPRAEEAVEVIHRENMETSLVHLMGRGEKFEQAMAYWQTLDMARFIKSLRLFPHVAETIENLSASYDLGVVTNRTRTTKQSLSHFGLRDFFKSVVTPLDTGKPKPDPSLMEMALEQLQCTREQVLYVGDSEVDQKLCQATGVRLIAFRGPELEAWAHVESFPDLAKVVRQAAGGRR